MHTSTYEIQIGLRRYRAAVVRVQDDPVVLTVRDEDGADVPSGTPLFRAVQSALLGAQAPHFVSARCRGERCALCREPAAHKVGEEVTSDDPFPQRHPLTAYLCCRCFRELMGPAAQCPA